MLAALISHTFQIVFSGHQDHTLFSQAFFRRTSLGVSRFSHVGQCDLEPLGSGRPTSNPANTWNPNPRRKFGLPHH
jgi:hypothetical protein